MKDPAPAPLESLDAAREAARLTLTKKAEDVLILDLSGVDAVSDYFVIATGNSEVQVKAIADAVEEGLAKGGRKPWHIEGYEARRWILLDYVDFVVHVFHVRAREYYLLDRLWGDVRRELVAD